jgi:hypothetical protein
MSDLLFRFVAHLFTADRPFLDVFWCSFMRCISLFCPFRRPIPRSFSNRVVSVLLVLSDLLFHLFTQFFAADRSILDASWCSFMRCISLCCPFPGAIPRSVENRTTSVFAVCFSAF